jgi:hypothetical protein
MMEKRINYDEIQRDTARYGGRKVISEQSLALRAALTSCHWRRRSSIQWSLASPIFDSIVISVSRVIKNQE